ncbi:MAG: HlyD family efflux transporter periplasmic adaptor subunit [Candidatus Brocadiaceae bacterium]|jgi:multidrug resistance efflux pump
MSQEGEDLSKAYELRRQARGVEPPREASPWKRRLAIGGLALVAVVVIAGALMLRWSLLFVRTTRAEVCGAVTDLSSGVDARLEELHVRAGDHVEPAQPLARLDDSEARASLAAARADEEIKQARYEQCRADLRLARARFEADLELAESRLEVARAEVTAAEAGLSLARRRVEEDVRRAEALHEQTRARLTDLEKGARREEIEAARARLAAARAQEQLYALEVRQSEQLVGEGIDSEHILEVKKTQLVTQQNKVKEAEMQLRRLLAGPSEEELEAARSGLRAREAELGLARVGASEVDRLAAELEVRRGEMEEAKAELARARAGTATVEMAEAELHAAAAELKRARAEVEGRRAVVETMTICSPVRGTVLRTFARVGEVCRKGEPIVMVADDAEGRWVEGYVSEQDAAEIEVGQPARVEIVAGSGDHVDAEVQKVSLYTTALEGQNPGAGRGAGGSTPARLVWVKLRLLGDAPDCMPGNTARATIRVR